jgi:HD superfamily phosphohydrolase
MADASKIDKKFKVRDPIYGFVKLDSQEIDIINSEYFQRLRRIKQLSLTDMVYPGATHTRFEHSLGVVQMATDMFDNIVAQNHNLEKLGINREDVRRTRKIIRLAALLHDVGHAPFSHAGEESMPLLPKGHYRYKAKSRYKHEDYSIAAIKMIFRDYIENHRFGEALGIKAEDITTLLGDQSISPTRSALIWSGLISGQLDADRADYLLRDSHHLGVNYGTYDRNRLINCITLGQSEETSDCFLAIEKGGWHVAESLVIARYQMFSQVYFHSVRRAFDYHVGKATAAVLESLKFKKAQFPPPNSVQNLKEYLNLDDWTMYSAFKNSQGGEHGAIILNRRPYKCKMEWDSDLSSKDRAKVNKDLKHFDGFLDDGATTKWYKLDKDIQIYDEDKEMAYPLSYKSKIVEVMPSLPKTVRLYISQEGEGKSYEFK